MDKFMNKNEMVDFYCDGLLDKIFGGDPNTKKEVLKVKNITDESVTYEMDLPGFNKDDIKITLSDLDGKTLLTITAKNDDRNEEYKYHSNDENVDRSKAEASLINGVLSITLYREKEDKNILNITIS